jgi:uncharacterized RDD family membrane protein YckC
MSRTNTLLIRTPEGVVFSQLLAGPMTRFLAWLVDWFCLVLLTIAAMIIMSLFGFISAGIAQAMGLLTQFVLMIGYSIVLEWFWHGQTLGKRMLRLRVVDAQGLRLKFSQVVMRNLLRFVDMLPVLYLVGGIACLISRRSQRLGDFAANTIVIRIPKVSEPHLEARLRQRVSAGEAAAAVQALARRDLLDLQSRIELFAEIAAHFRSKIQFPPEATDGIADEQFVRNVVDSLYRSGRTEKKVASATVNLVTTP